MLRQSSRIRHGVSRGGGRPHVSGELFKMMAGVDMLHVHIAATFPHLLTCLGGKCKSTSLGWHRHLNTLGQASCAPWE